MKGRRGGRFRLAAPLVALALAGCSKLQSALHPAGPQAGRIEDLWWLMFAVSTAVYLAVIAMLLYAALRPRRRHQPEDEAILKLEPAAERRMAAIVIGAVSATTIVLFALVVTSYLTDRTIAALAQDSDPLRIDVTAHQWWWELRYRDPNPSRSFTTANEIHVPVGRTVALALKSDDVIHSFWAPNLHGKQDLIPGRDNALYFRADRPGTYRGQCAEFCGYQHAHMAFLVIAEPPDAFARWRDNQIGPAAEPDTPEERRGRDVFLAAPCVMCHTIRGTSAGGKVAPELTHLASRRTLAAGTLPNSRGPLAAWIIDPQRIKPGNHMPLNGLPPRDLQALLTYLQSLR